MSYYKTNRSFKNVETGAVFNLYRHTENNDFKLISEGDKNHAKDTEVNGFYISSFTDCHIKLNTGKIITLHIGAFYNLKENEIITHRKFTGFKKFTKIN